jgi:hypothetical protein
MVFARFCGAEVVVAALLVTEVAMLGSVSAAFQQCRQVISPPFSADMNGKRFGATTDKRATENVISETGKVGTGLIAARK